MNIIIYESQIKSIKEKIKSIHQYITQQNEIEQYQIHTYNNNSLIDQQTTYDLAFLCISQDDTNALELAKRLMINNPSCFIMFISDSYQYIRNAFHIQAFQYIMTSTDISLIHQELKRMILTYKNRNMKFMLHTNKGKILFHSNDIIFVETYYNHMRITTHQNTYLANIKQKTYLQNILKTLSFIKIHRSYMINMKYIQNFIEDGVLLKNKVFLPTSPLRKEEIMIEYNKFQKNRGEEKNENISV